MECIFSEANLCVISYLTFTFSVASWREVLLRFPFNDCGVLGGLVSLHHAQDLDASTLASVLCAVPLQSAKCNDRCKVQYQNPTPPKRNSLYTNELRCGMALAYVLDVTATGSTCTMRTDIGAVTYGCWSRPDDGVVRYLTTDRIVSERIQLIHSE